ncbi:MAG TPA: tryptophan synthase subunit alpha [Rhodothermales bacterium]|nr:tryptophan synthase subunit alpha [Rhodothermales bacterium]
MKARGEKAAGLFLTSGFPDPENTLPILQAIDEGGADFIEFGMPFSDPLGEGLPIQRSSERALRHGVTMRDAFRTVEAFRKNSDTPLLLMGYVNPIHRYGVAAFCRDAKAAGVDGLILPDLPPEESDIVDGTAREHDLSMVYLIAPNTPDERVGEIDRKASAFVYAVSVTGLTGTGLGTITQVENYLIRARSLVTRNPLMVGFGIKSHEDALRLSRYTDGFIVGSALINLVDQLWDDERLTNSARLEQVRVFVRSLKYGDVEVGAS